jgi:hypothetical protein
MLLSKIDSSDKTKPQRFRVFEVSVFNPYTTKDQIMSESIALIIKSFEVIMEKYGYWKVSILILLCMIIWRCSYIIAALKLWF